LVLQRGHCEGVTIVRPKGRRLIRTLEKLPNVKPNNVTIRYSNITSS